MSEENGIVTLEELSEKEIFLDLEESDRVNIKEMLKNAKNFSKFLVENGFKDWFYNKTKKLRLDKFKRILKLFNISNIKIKMILGKQGLPIKYPRLPLNFTTREGVRFVACILGDGCIHEKGIRYYNKNETLIKNFIRLARKIFGNVSYKRYVNENGVIAISLPEVCKKVVKHIGLFAGRKSTRNVRIPKFVFRLTADKRLEFISQFVDDEGYINDGNIVIDLGFEDGTYPYLINDLKKLINTLGVSSSVYPASEYYSFDNRKRRMWRLGIFTFGDAKKLGEGLNLLNSSKHKRCKDLLALKRREIYKGLDTYVQKMREVENKKGYFSTLDLATTTNRSIRQARRILNGARKLGIVKLVEPACKGYKNVSYATYRLR